MLWLKGCGASEPVYVSVPVTVPEVSGSLPEEKPGHKQIDSTKTITKNVINPINQKLIAENKILKYKYAKADSALQAKMYSDAIAVQDFTYQQEDQYLKLSIVGKVGLGEVQSILPTYTIKERIVESRVKFPVTKYRILLGGEIGASENFDFTSKANLAFQNQKGNMITASYQRVNGVDYVLAGYYFNLYTRKK